MIFRSLKIEGFGIHRDLELGDLSPGLNVVFGENEAGKTTLLQFVRAVLFGFEERKQPARRYEPLAGGRHGGSITIEVDGERLRLSRFFRPGKAVAGESAAEDASGAAVDPASAWGRALGNASRVLFQNVFSLELEDLLRFPALDADGLREHVYGAAITGRGISLPVVLESLRKRSRELLTTAGKSGKVARLLDDIARLRMEAGALAERPAEHARLVERAAEVSARVASLESSLPALEEERRLAERLSRAAGFHAALAALPDHPPERPKFPSGGLERLKECQEALSRARAAAQRAGARRDDLTARVKAARWDARLVEHGPEIDAVFGESDRRVGNDAPGQALVRAQAAAERARALAESLGVDWPPERIAAFDASPASERELIAILDRRAEAERRAREARRDAEVAGDAARRDVEAAARLAAEIESIGDAADRGAKLEKRVAEFERTLDEERAAAAVWADIQRRSAVAGTKPEARVVDAIAREQNRPLYYVAGLAAAVGAALAFFGSPLAGAITFVAAIGLVAYAVYRLPIAVPFAGPGARETEEARAALERLRGSLKDRSILSFGRPDGRAEDAHRIRDEIGRLKALGARRLEAERLLSEAKASAERSARAAEEKRRLAEDAGKALAEGGAALEAWLAAHGFPPATPPEAARSTVLAAREVKQAETAAAEARAEVARLETAAREFAERVEALGAKLDRPGLGRGPAAAIHVALTALQGESRSARAVKSDLDRDAAELARAEEEAKTAAAEGREAEKRLQALLAEAAAFDVEVFHGRAKAAEAWERAEEERVALQGKLRAALGDDVPPEARQRLEKAAPEELERDVRERAARIEAVRAERDALLEERARLEAARKSMESEAALSQVRLAEEGRIEELAAAAEQWHVLAAAEWLIDSARRRFEEEHQPAILRSAGRLLQTMTAGRWTRIAADRDAPDDPLRVTRFDGETLPVSALSRGTLEQLYLCLRLALAADFPDPGVRLPVLLDDVLVNFSGARRAGAARAIAEVAARVQVIAFTCHPELRDALLAASPQAKRVELPEPAAPAAKITLAHGG